MVGDELWLVGGVAFEIIPQFLVINLQKRYWKEYQWQVRVKCFFCVDKDFVYLLLTLISGSIERAGGLDGSAPLLILREIFGESGLSPFGYMNFLPGIMN